MLSLGQGYSLVWDTCLLRVGNPLVKRLQTILDSTDKHNTLPMTSSVMTVRAFNGSLVPRCSVRLWLM